MQCFEIGSQLQKESGKKHEYVEIKQHATKELLSQRRNVMRAQKIHRDKRMWQRDIETFGI